MLYVSRCFLYLNAFEATPFIFSGPGCVLEFSNRGEGRKPQKKVGGRLVRMNMATGSDGTSPKAEAMAASDALRRLCGDLVRVMQEPELLACDLYAEGIVPQSALEEMNVVGIIPTQKRMKLLSLVIDQVAVDAERLPKFIQLLKKRPPMVEVAERLERTFGEYWSV